MAALVLPHKSKIAVARRNKNLLRNSFGAYKPTKPVVLDLTHPLSRGLISYWCPLPGEGNNPSNLVPGVKNVQQDDPSWYKTATYKSNYGIINNTSTQLVSFEANNHKRNSLTDYTIICCLYTSTAEDIGYFGFTSNQAQGGWLDLSGGQIRFSQYTTYSTYNWSAPNIIQGGLIHKTDGSIDFINAGRITDSASSAMGTPSGPLSIWGSNSNNASKALRENGSQVAIYHAIWMRALSEAEVKAFSQNPYQILRPANQSPFLIGVPAGGAITGTGALSSQNASIAGTGTLTRTGTGALSAQAAEISGVGEITHTGTGALSAQVSAVVGVGAVSGAITGTGALAAQASSLSGVGALTRVGTGALASQSSDIAGVGEISHIGTGALSAQVSNLAGTGTVVPAGAVTGTGALDAQTSSLAGAGVLTRVGTGALAAQASSLAGTGSLFELITGTGSLASQSSQITGLGTLFELITGTGALASQASEISGTGTLLTTITGTGDLVAGSSSVSGSDAGLWTEIARTSTTWTEIL